MGRCVGRRVIGEVCEKKGDGCGCRSVCVCAGKRALCEEEVGDCAFAYMCRGRDAMVTC